MKFLRLFLIASVFLNCGLNAVIDDPFAPPATGKIKEESEIKKQTVILPQELTTETQLY